MHKVPTILYLGVSVLSLATPAFAQAVPPSATPEAADAQDDTGALAPDNEIVITARRREESVQDVPQTVNVVTAAQVEKLNLRNFQEIASIVPGLTMTQTSAFSSQATVRGVAFVPEASGNNPSVEFYLNDAPISSGFLFQSTYDFGQFELQRGPQGTLRGRASPSGSIAVTTRRPDLNEIGFVANGTATNLSAYKLDGALNIPIINDVLALRLAGVVDYNRGNRVHSIKEVSDPQNNEGPYRRTHSYRASLRFEPTDWIAANVMYQRLTSKDHSFAQVVSDSLIAGTVATTPIIAPFDRLGLDDQGAFGRQDHKVLIGNLDVRFAGQRLSYVGGYTKQAFGSLGPQDAGDFYSPPRVNLALRTFADPVGFEQVCRNESRRVGLQPTTGTFYQCTSGKGIRKSHELRLASEERIAGIFDYVVGGLYDHNENPNRLTSETPRVGNVPPPTTNATILSTTAIIREAESTEKSVFGNLTAHFGGLELSGGLRYIDYKSNSTLQQNATITSTQDDHDNATVYLASIKYQITPDVMVYALTGSSWRPGPRVVFVNQTLVTPREQGFTELPPERSKSYEIGAKTSFLDGRGRFNVSAYYQKFKNYPFRGPNVAYLQYRLVNGVQTLQGVNNFNFVAPVPVTVKGVEAEASFQITPRWSIGGNVAYSDGRIKNGTIACTDIDQDGVPDTNAATPTLAQLQNALPPGENVAICSGINRRSLTSPKFSANLQSEFGFSLAPSVDGFLRGSSTLFGKTRNDPTNTFDDVGFYGLLNLFAGVRDPDGEWEVTLFGKNILREREVLNVGSGVLATSYRTNVAQTYLSEYRSVTVTAPREFGVTVRVATGSR